MFSIVIKPKSNIEKNPKYVLLHISWNVSFRTVMFSSIMAKF